MVALANKKGNPIQIIFGTGASSAKDYESLYMPIYAAVESGIMAFDTAPSYKTEIVLAEILSNVGSCLSFAREDFFIQTKIDPIQMYEGNIERHVEKILKDMKLEYIDSLLVHWPVVEYMEKTWDSFARLKECGVCRYIGICNVRTRQLKEILKYTLQPDIIQVERHPLRICKEDMSVCKQYGYVLQAYSPLCKMDERIRNNEELKKIAEKYKKNIGQIIMRWHIDSGDIPVFTSKNASRVREYAASFDFSLTDQEIKKIDGFNINYKMYLESLICPGI